MPLAGRQLMFHRRFRSVYGSFVLLWGAWMVGHYIQGEWDKEAYAMRGQSNLFKEDYKKLKASGENRELWK